MSSENNNDIKRSASAYNLAATGANMSEAISTGTAAGYRSEPMSRTSSNPDIVYIKDHLRELVKTQESVVMDHGYGFETVYGGSPDLEVARRAPTAPD